MKRHNINTVSRKLQKDIVPSVQEPVIVIFARNVQDSSQKEHNYTFRIPIIPIQRVTLVYKYNGATIVNEN